LRLVARALHRREHQPAPVRGDVRRDADLLLARLLEDDAIGRLRRSDAVEKDLWEVVLLARRHRSGLRIARVIDAAVVGGPGDPAELRPEQPIAEVGARLHVANEDLLAIAAAARDGV